MTRLLVPALAAVVATSCGSAVRPLPEGFHELRADGSSRGFAIAQQTKAGTTVAVMFDEATEFGRSFAGMSKAWRDTLPGPPPETPLERRQLADGSGGISVPAQWTVNAQNAMVSAFGAEGTVDLGLNAQVYEPSANMFGLAPVVSRFGDPAENFRDVLSKFTKTGPASIQILERGPYAGWTTGPAAAIHFVMPYNNTTSEGVGIVLTQQTGFGSFMFYTSFVTAPQASFAASLPTLTRVWTSWKTSDAVFQQRLNAAMNSMRRVGEIVREVNDNRQQAMDRSNAAWDHYIRGTWTYEDRSTGKRVDGPNDAGPLIDDLNRAEGYQRFRAVPYADLLRK